MQAQLEGFVQPDTLAGAAKEIDALQDLLLSLGAEPLEPSDATLQTGFLQLGEVVDAKLVVESLHLLWPHTRKAQQVKQASGSLRAARNTKATRRIARAW